MIRIPAKKARAEIILPVCPSVNALYKNARRGRVKTPAYQAWCTEVGYQLNAAGVRPVPTPVAIVMRFGKLPSNSDLANREKALTDILVTHKIIPDDNVQHVHLLTVERAFDTVPAGYVEITVNSLVSE